MTKVHITDIIVPEGRDERRAIQPHKVKAIAESVAEFGLLHPITIKPNNELIAGLHRLEAYKSLGLAEIECTVFTGDDLEARLVEIDENLARADLSKLEESLQLAERKAIYEAMYPEAAHGGDRKSNEYKSSGQAVHSFSEDAAEKTGNSDRTIRRRTALGERLEMFADLIRGTPIEDNQSELQRLAKLDDAEIVDVLEIIRSGKADSVKTAKRELKKRQYEERPKPELGTYQDNGSKVVIGDARDMDLAQFDHYGVIVADPPWPYRVAKGQGTAEEQYDVLSENDLCTMPVAQLALENCALFLWGTWPKLPEALMVMDAWGFEYVTGLPWVKTTTNGELSYGVGYWVRGASEFVLIGRRGKVSAPRLSGFMGLLSPNLQHSRKPDSVHVIAEALDGPYLELFARRARPGWTVFGNEIQGVMI